MTRHLSVAAEGQTTPCTPTHATTTAVAEMAVVVEVAASCAAAAAAAGAAAPAGKARETTPATEKTATIRRRGLQPLPTACTLSQSLPARPR